MAITRAAGSTSEIVNVYFRDSRSVSTVGMPNVSSTSIAFSWCRSNQATQSSGTCSSGGTLGSYTANALTQISSTSTLGWYQWGIDNGALASGGSVILHVWSRTSTAGVSPFSLEIDLLGNIQPVSVSTMTTPVGVSSHSVNVGVSTVAVLVGVSTLSVPVGVSSHSVNVGVSTLAASVSSVTGLVAVSSLQTSVSSVTGAVNVSSATVTLGVSTLATSVSSVTGSVNISSYSRQAGVSSASVDFGVSTIAPAQKLVGVSTNTDKTGYSLAQTFPTNFSALGITPTGAVSLNWASIENPATVQSLPGTDIGIVASVAGAVGGSVLGDVTGSVLGTVGGVAAGVGVSSLNGATVLGDGTSGNLWRG